MPTYDYECTKCGHKFEKTQSMSDKPLKECPKCGKPVKRLIGSGGGIIFKGAGFYATDYRKKEKQDAPSCPAAKTCGAPSCPKKE